MPSLSENDIQIRISSTADTKAVDKASRSVDRLEDTSKQSSSKIGAFFKSNFGAAGAAAGLFVGSLGLATGAALKQAGSLEQTRVGFETMLKSGKKAGKLMQEISQFAKETPFEFPELARSARLLLAFGDNAQQVIPHLKIIGDTAAAMGEGADGVDRITRALGQMQAKGKVSAEEMNQLSEIGVNGFALLAKETGKSEAELRKLAEQGKLLAKDAIPMLYKGMNKAFGGGMQKQSKTLNGLLSTLSDTIGMTVNKFIGIDESGNIREGSIFSVARDAVSKLIPWLEKLQPKLLEFGEWVAANKPVLAAFAGAIGGLIVLAIGALVMALGGALIVMGTFMLAGAALGALAYIIVQKWDTIKGFFTGLWETVKGYTTAFMDWVNQKVNWFKNNWASAIGFVLGFFATLPVKMPMYIFRAMSIIVGYLRGINWGAILSGIWQAMQAVWDKVTGMAVKAWHFMRNLKWSEIMTGIAKGIGNAIMGLIEGAINGALSGIPGSPSVSIPRFAKGVRNFGGGLAIVGEQGPELVGLPRGSNVYSNRESKQMASSGATYNIQNVNLTTANAVSEFFNIQTRNAELLGNGLTPRRV